MQEKAIAIKKTFSTPKGNWKAPIIHNAIYHNLVDVDSGGATYRQPTINLSMPKKDRFDVTSLKGKMSSISSEKIDKQIDDLRNEWDRGF